MTATRTVRLQLSENEARALHSAVEEAIAAGLLPTQRQDAARTVLGRLGKRVPDWLDHSPVGGEAGYLTAADAVLRALIAAEERGRDTLTDIELAHALGDDKPAGVTIDRVLRRMLREKLIRCMRSVSIANETCRWMAVEKCRSMAFSRWAGGAPRAGP
jgi:hypothetical protein